MKKILENWKKFNLKEQNELDTPSPQQDPVDIMRSVLEEVQNMASRLIEIEEQLKNNYSSGVSNYHPGKDFLIAAQKLADSKDFQSLASKINRFIENEVSLPIAQKKFDDKYRK